MSALLLIVGLLIALGLYRSYANARVNREVASAITRIEHDVSSFVEHAMINRDMMYEMFSNRLDVEAIASHTASMLSDYMQNRYYRNYFDIIDDDQIIETIASRAISNALRNAEREHHLGIRFSFNVRRIARES